MKSKIIKLFGAALMSVLMFAAGTYADTSRTANGIPVFAEGEDPSTVYFRDEASVSETAALAELSRDRLAGIRVCPGGQPFGVKMNMDGILVIGTTDVETQSGTVTSPGRRAGILPGDVIKYIDGERAYDADALKTKAIKSGGKALTLNILRGGEYRNVSVDPVLSKNDGEYKLGLWVKSRAAGIGTVTFCYPEDGRFAGLGHGICDTETGALLPLAAGEVYGVRIDGVCRGTPGMPGELKGYFASGKTGALLDNTPFGVFGIIRMNNGETDTIPVAGKDELKVGAAEVRCTVSGNLPETYTAEIEEIDQSNKDTKNFVIKITDPELLKSTGGIVQGMSGSPIIQNGKLVGALTHVLVNDPARGYGIFIENMLSAMESN